MIADLNPKIVERLIQEFHFKPRGEHLREGVCPSCGKKTLWTWMEKPGMVQCNRTNNCNWQSTSKELLPDLFENLNKKYPPTETNPTQTADVYLSLIRGFDPELIRGWYEQGKYWHPKGDKGTASVRFYLDADKTVMWERLIDDVTIVDEDGDKEVRNKNFKGSFRGFWWQPPGLSIEPDDNIYWCEGILDAIALNLSGYKAVAIMSSGTFPSESIKPHLGKKVKWVLALDNDATGRRCLKKHAQKLRDMHEDVSSAISSEFEEKADWNDLYKSDRLSPDQMKYYRYLGRLELAQNYVEKAFFMWQHNESKGYFVFIFGRSTYSFVIDEKLFKEAEERILIEKTKDKEKAKRLAFVHASKIKEIGTFKMDFLYFQKPDNGDDGQYFFRFNFSNRAAEIQLPFSGKVFGSASDFKKMVMHKTPSALFTGTTKDLDYLFKQWMSHIPKIVKTLDFVGYDKDTGSYVYNDFAVEKGKILNLNNESFFQLSKTGIKTGMDIKQSLTVKHPIDWLPSFQTAFGLGGMVTLSWWFGCLFAVQVRHKYRSYPYFELIGPPASGKSDMVDFLWKLLGKEGDSFNPNSSTRSGIARRLASVSNLPVIFNETDNEQTAEDRHSKKFNWDEYKDLYDGEIDRVTGVKSNDNSFRQQPFRGGLIVVQNIPVVASDAIITRFIHMLFDRSHHSLEGEKASRWLKGLDITDVSGFLLHALKHEEAVLKLFEQRFNHFHGVLQNTSGIKLPRIIKNHAMVMAFADCLKLVIPVSDQTILDVQNKLISMAIKHQDSLNEDHPIVQQFWSNFDFMNSRSFWRQAENHGEHVVDEHTMNHSTTPETEIAINLEHFRQRCAEMKLEIIETKELRRHLKTSRSHPFIRNDSIKSRLENRSMRCWIFKV